MTALPLSTLLLAQMTPPAESSWPNDWDSMHSRRKSSMVASLRTSPSRTNGEP